MTNRDDVASSARVLRQYGWEVRYRSTRPYGRNSRIDELQAAFLRELLADLDVWTARRRAIRHRYQRAFGARLPIVQSWGDGGGSVAHLCVVRSTERDRLAAALSADGIDTAVHYPTPDHLQPAIRNVPFRCAALDETERACREVLSLPCFPELRDDEVERVVAAVERAL